MIETADLIEVTDATFADVVFASEMPVLVEFGAPWCGPCKMIEPALKQIAAEQIGRLKVVAINTDENPAIASALHVLGLPTLQLYVGGRQVVNIVGAKPKSVLMKAISDHLS